MAACRRIDKRHLKATALFAIHHVSRVDRATLEKLLELVNAEGNFGTISEGQLIQKIGLLTKHVPGVCRTTLLTLTELLEIPAAFVPRVEGVATDQGDPRGWE